MSLDEMMMRINSRRSAFVGFYRAMVVTWRGSAHDKVCKLQYFLSSYVISLMVVETTCSLWSVMRLKFAEVNI